MDQILRATLLFDFYADLLTEHQRNVYEDVELRDISYAEAAQVYGISRQGVHDLVKRCNRLLEEYESKLHLVERFLSIKEKVAQIRDLSDDARIRGLSDEILEEL